MSAGSTAVLDPPEETKAAPAEEPKSGAKVIDLMEALRASLEKKEARPAAAKPAATVKLGPRKAPKRVEQPAAKPARKTARR